MAILVILVAVVIFGCCLWQMRKSKEIFLARNDMSFVLNNMRYVMLYNVYFVSPSEWSRQMSITIYIVCIIHNILHTHTLLEPLVKGTS